MIYDKSADTQMLSINNDNRSRRLKPKKTWLRVLVMAINFLFMVGGLGLLGAGVYAFMAPAYLISMLGSHLLRDLAILFIVIGSFVLLFSILGCCGAKFEKKCCLSLYIFLIFIVFISVVISLIVLLTKEEEVKAKAAKHMKEQLKKIYGFNTTFTDLVDLVQIKLRCCGVWTGRQKAYDEARWYHNQPVSPKRLSLPQSCCVKSRTGVYLNKDKCQKAGLHNWREEDTPYYYSLGCLDALWDTWSKYRSYVVASGAVELVILVALFFITIAYLRQIRKYRSSSGYTMRDPRDI